MVHSPSDSVNDGSCVESGIDTTVDSSWALAIGTIVDSSWASIDNKKKIFL